MRTKVAVIGGGQNCEHAVSLASAASARAALEKSCIVVALTIGADGIWLLRSEPLGTTPATSLAGALRVMAACDVVLPLLHGPRGEDGTIAALCDLAGARYVGSGVRAGALAMDKWATKLVASALGIPTAQGVLVTRATAPSISYVAPVVVKPVSAGSSHGVSLVTSADRLEPALAAALALDDRVLVEERLVGREVDIAVLQRPNGSRFVSPPLEIVVDHGLFDTEHKYDGSAVFHVPAALAEVERKEIEAAALALFDGLGCAGVARFDFFVTEKGVVLNEVNTMPGMTAQSQVPRMFAAVGLPYAALLTDLVNGALG
ncbi:MAG: D-alanine--D-alanine ligase [Marmoricola sp.]|jgi:D-alanine-D-alanine ligase|nr:D-alanine--D-alanine ligase [Marmoricola sp.]